MDVQEFMNLPYNFIVRQISDESGTYFHATVLELDGCQSTGETLQEAYGGLREAMAGWLETKIENGFQIPNPVSQEAHSGKFVLRLPKSLHSRLVIAARREGVSLNQYALYKLTQ